MRRDNDNSARPRGRALVRSAQTALLRSVRTQIITLAAGSALAVLVLLAIPVGYTIENVADEEAQQAASTTAQGVADFISGSAQRNDIGPLVNRVNRRGNDHPVTVALSDGTLIGARQPRCGTATSTSDETNGGDRGDGDGEIAGLRPTSTASIVRVSEGRLVQIDSSDSSGVVSVCALASDAGVRAEVATRLAGLGTAGLVTVLIVAAAALFVAGRLNRHLAGAARTADQLAEGDLAARASETGPTEVRRVAVALNRLAVRIEELLAAERETVADLSHRLRTPLMAVRLDAEALAESPEKAELEDHLNALERTLTAVIHTARRPQREGAVPRADTFVVLRERFDFWNALLEDQGRTAKLDLDPTLDATLEARTCRSSPADLGAAIDALLENTAAHTNPGTPVRARLRADGRDLVLSVEDQGPGIPAEALQRGRSDRGSTGLGLDIARSCARAAGGELAVERRGDWTVVEMRLPVADHSESAQPRQV